MTGALLYLQLTSLRNAVLQRVSRLRRPRYLAATLLGAAYLYFFIFRGFVGRPGGRHAEAAAGVGLAVGVAVALLLMLGRLAWAWIFSADRAALAFTEAEAAFLFPAPISRRRLINFKLLKSQLRILLSAVIFSIVSNRFASASTWWMHAAGWWILFSTLDLHGIAASFTRERLIGLGLDPVRRRLLFGGSLLLLGAGLGWWIRQTVPPPAEADLAGVQAFTRYLQAAQDTPPLSWLLAPLLWVVGPFFAPDAAAFLRALGPALLVLGAHYVWVIRSEVAFEEASIELSRRKAERAAALLAGGGLGTGRRPARRRRDPFPLPPSGPAPLAFLWRNLIAAGPLFHPRNWALLSAAVLAGAAWLAAHPAHRVWLSVVAGVSAPLGLWVPLAGPMFLRRDVRLLFERIDVVKVYPLRGWQVVGGEMLSPVVMITAVEWLVIGVHGIAAGALGPHGAPLFLGWPGLAGIALITPPIVGLMMAIPFAATLYFPDWMAAVGQPGGGLDLLGQRLLFSGAYLLALVAALIPAALAALPPYFLMSWIAGSRSPALLGGAAAAFLVLVGECAAVVWWLGRRYERFDLSRELPQ